MKTIFLYIVIIAIMIVPIYNSIVSRDTIVTEIIEAPVPVEGVYNVPFVQEPKENGYVSLTYFEDVILYMMVNDIYSQSCKLLNVSNLDAEAESIFDIATEAYRNMVAKYHEYGCYYENIDFELNAKGTEVTLTINIFDIDFTNEQITFKKNQFFEQINEIVADMYASGEISESDTDFVKAQYLYRWCAYNMKCDEDLKADSFTGYGALFYKTAVCQGYTAVYSALCNAALIECVSITGTAKGEPHIWSYANLDGKWSYIDVTFGDPLPDRANYCDESYFAVTAGALASTHIFDK